MTDPLLMSAQIFSVVQRDGAWSVEHDGHYSSRSHDKAVAVASATKLARAALASGRPAQVRIEGETGYF